MSRHFHLIPSSPFLLLLHAWLLGAAVVSHAEPMEHDKQAYIVYLGDRLDDIDDAAALHIDILSQGIISDEPSERLIHSYRKSFNAMAAMLTKEEANILSTMEEVVAVFPSEQKELHTTRSWSFINFPYTAPRAALESDVIVGMLDTGIWPESKSFDDDGFGPPPPRWNGSCQSANDNFTCNNKIIGARYYHLNGNISRGNIASPRDTIGHGTHTASTAAGRTVANASLSGLAQGTARGGVPSARLAVYKVCWQNEGCSDIDLLAGFDDAIADGVDIISISIGAHEAVDYFSDPIAIGSFHAMQKGILISSSAGNSGPTKYTIFNTAPWLLTVAASSIDRKFVTQLKLGNGNVYQGLAVNTEGSNDPIYPLIYAANAPNITAGISGSTSRFCKVGTLDSNVSKGSILICDGPNDGSGPQLAGAVGAVIPTRRLDVAFEYKLPAFALSYTDNDNIFLYSNTTSHPKASISKSEGVLDNRAPYIASFSSRGPNPITTSLLKPDLSGPGVDILAAWSPLSSEKSSLYNIVSGTSMACPHASATAAYVKSFNPTWSPAAIKSALITTTNIMSPEKNEDAEFAYGAGQVNPLGAVNPGLIYDVDEIDYVKFLCGQGYTTKNLRLITGDSTSCTSEINGTIFDLNYPTFALSITQHKPFLATYHRTVTNVGSSNSSYNVNVTGPSELKITVNPQVLTFQKLFEKKSFEVTLEGETNSTQLSASLVWNDGVHNVRSPIIVYVP